MPRRNFPQKWRVRKRMIRHPMPGLVHYNRKNPALAAALSVFVPGLGQLYNGHFFKGIFFFFCWWLIIPYFIGIGDAYFSARRQLEFQDRLLLQNLLTTVEERDYEPYSGQGTYSVASRSEIGLSELDEFERNQRRYEKRMVTGGALAGFGAALEAITVFVGGGIALSVVGLIPLTLGGTMFYWGWKKQKEWKLKREREEEKKLEKIVVTIAQSKDGHVTVADLVARTELGMQEAEQILNSLVTKGYADIRVTDEGVITYHF